jgi:hypothetical protein
MHLLLILNLLDSWLKLQLKQNAVLVECLYYKKLNLEEYHDRVLILRTQTPIYKVAVVQ